MALSIGLTENSRQERVIDLGLATLAIGACIFAAIRLGRKSDAELTPARVASTITQSVLLAKTILTEVKRLG